MRRANSTAQYQASFPVFAAEFVNKTRFVIAGGGGVGRHGVANGFRALEIDEDAELTEVLAKDLEKGSDSPTSMTVVAYEQGPEQKLVDMRDVVDFGGETKVALLVGIGEGTNSTDKTNRHLRFFSASDLQACKPPGGNSDEVLYDLLKLGPEANVGYQRAIATSACQQLIAVGSANTKNDFICIASFSNPEKALWKALAPEGPRDASFSADGLQLAVCTDKLLTIYDSKTGKELFPPKQSIAPRSWTHAQFVSDSRLVVGSHDRRNGKAWLTVYDCDEKLTEVFSKQLSGAKAISALAATPNNIAIGTPGGDIFVYTRRLVPLQKIREFHQLAITSVAIDPEDKFVVSTSFGGSVGALKISRSSQAADRFWSSIPGTAFWMFAWASLVLTLAVLGAVYYGNNLLAKLPEVLEYAPGSAQGFINRHVKHVALEQSSDKVVSAEATPTVDTTVLADTKPTGVAGTDILQPPAEPSTKAAPEPETTRAEPIIGDPEPVKEQNQEVEPAAEPRAEPALVVSEPQQVSAEETEAAKPEPVETVPEPVEQVLEIVETDFVPESVESLQSKRSAEDVNTVSRSETVVEPKVASQPVPESPKPAEVSKPAEASEPADPAEVLPNTVKETKQPLDNNETAGSEAGVEASKPVEAFEAHPDAVEAKQTQENSKAAEPEAVRIPAEDKSEL